MQKEFKILKISYKRNEKMGEIVLSSFPLPDWTWLLMESPKGSTRGKGRWAALNKYPRWPSLLIPLMLSCHKLMTHSTATEQSWSLSLWKIASGAHTGIHKGLGTIPTPTDKATLWPVPPYLIQQVLKSNLFPIPSGFICNLNPSCPIVGPKQDCCGLGIDIDE